MSVIVDLIRDLNGEEFSLLLDAVTNATISEWCPETRAELLEAVRREAKQQGGTPRPALLMFVAALHDDDAAKVAAFCDGFFEGQNAGERECLLDYWETLRQQYPTDRAAVSQHSLADMVSNYLKACAANDFDDSAAFEQVAVALTGNYGVVEELLQLCHRAVDINR